MSRARRCRSCPRARSRGRRARAARRARPCNSPGGTASVAGLKPETKSRDGARSSAKPPLAASGCSNGSTFVLVVRRDTRQVTARSVADQVVVAREDRLASAFVGDDEIGNAVVVAARVPGHDRALEQQRALALLLRRRRAIPPPILPADRNAERARVVVVREVVGHGDVDEVTGAAVDVHAATGVRRHVAAHRIVHHHERVLREDAAALAVGLY